MSQKKPRILVIGAGFAGLLAARDLRREFDVTVVDCKEYFEYTPGILRAYVKPSHFDHLTFTLQPVIEGKLKCKFICGEVTKLDGEKQVAHIKCKHLTATEEYSFDYCMVAAGCNFGPFSKWGESLWFPTVHESARKESDWKHTDEGFLEGRRRHILEEHNLLQELNANKANVLIVGAGFIGVEWVTELQHYFPGMKLTIIDFLPRPLGPLPEKAATYCQEYMERVGIRTVYNVSYDPNNPDFWEKIGLPGGADKTYVCIGVKASNYFMPSEVLSEKGPGGGGWILMNKKLQVITKEDKVWGNGKVFAVGDCNYGCIGDPSNWELPPLPKISYPAEEQAAQACKMIRILAKADGYSSGCFGGICLPRVLPDTWWPWGSGMFATSLGPDDACFVLAANEKKGSGYLCFWKGWPSAFQKMMIESTKVDECRGGRIGRAIWHYVHHTPIQLIGKGPLCP